MSTSILYVSPSFLYDFPLLPGNDVVGIGAYTLLVCLAENMCAFVKGLRKIVDMREHILYIA